MTVKRPAEYLFRPFDEVVRELGELPEPERHATLTEMLAVSESTGTLAKKAIVALGMEGQRDLVEYASTNPWSAPKPRMSLVDVRAGAAPLSQAAIRALNALGVDRKEHADFAKGVAVATRIAPTTANGDPTEGYVQLMSDRLISSIVTVRDVGGGLASIMGFRTKSIELARAVDRPEVELVGHAILNDRLGRVLVRQGFEFVRRPLPDLFGGGDDDVFFKRFDVEK